MSPRGLKMATVGHPTGSEEAEVINFRQCLNDCCILAIPGCRQPKAAPDDATRAQEASKTAPRPPKRAS
eukprot:5365873-Pyramimonas_sp.AAC.1